jgi:protoheme IX farnesyltransferase
VPAEEIYPLKNELAFMSKVSDYVQFAKLRLSTLVVFSAAISYVTVSAQVDWIRLMALVLGGFLVTASSNGINQILERETDKLMTRTANRPLPQGRMSLQEAIIVAFVLGLSGALILFLFINVLSGILGVLALLLYTMVYTPLKRRTPFAVFAGAFPGAIPPLLGCVAASTGFGHFSTPAWILFSIQFIWQFPHFWAIAWVQDDDYKKAGFKLLPSSGGRDKASAFQVLMYTLFLLPISLTPVFFGMAGTISAITITVCGLIFIYQAQKLFNHLTVNYARNLMFGSFLYLPLVQIAIMLGR